MPELLYQLDRMGRYLKKTFPEVVKVSGFPSLIKRMNQVMHVGIGPSGPAFTREELSHTLRQALADAERAELSGTEALNMILRQLNVNGERYYEVPVDPASYGLADNEGLAPAARPVPAAL